MNYQEALDEFKKHMALYHRHPVSKEQDENIAILQQAVDKANKYDAKETALKIESQPFQNIGLSEPNEHKYTVLICPNCKQEVEEKLMMAYCYVCGQKLTTDMVGEEK